MLEDYKIKNLKTKIHDSRKKSLFNKDSSRNKLNNSKELISPNSESNSRKVESNIAENSDRSNFIESPYVKNFVKNQDTISERVYSSYGKKDKQKKHFKSTKHLISKFEKEVLKKDASDLFKGIIFLDLL